MRRPGLMMAIGLVAAAWGAVRPAAHAAEETTLPRTGTITAYNVNIRAGAHLNYEILTKLDKGDLVLITKRRGDWTRIAMPPGVLVWVSSSYVADDGLVEGSRVNVRSGPALKYNVLCQLQRDDKVIVKERSDDGDWYGIVPPEAAGAYVYAKYVEAKGPPALYAAWAPRKEQCVALLAAADRLRAAELKRPEASIRFDAMIEQYGRLESDYADLPEARVAKRRIQELERLKKRIVDGLAGGSTRETAGTEGTESESQEQAEPKYLTAKGVVREISSESTKAGLYRITREDRWICIVRSGTLGLDAYVGKEVQVWGLEAPSEGWSLRTINVSRVKLLE